MKRADLLARLDRLERDRDQLVANANAYNGAIEEVRYWLGVVEKAEAAAKAEAEQTANSTQVKAAA